MQRAQEGDDEHSGRARCRDGRRTLFVDLEDDGALIRAHDAQIGRYGDGERSIATPHGEEVDAIPTPNLGERGGEPRRRYRDGPRGHREALGQ